MRSIDADDLIKQFEWLELCRLSKDEIYQVINEAPTVEERTKGLWKYKEYNYYCSNCGDVSAEFNDYPYLSNYCPWCGAKMEIDDENIKQ